MSGNGKLGKREQGGTKWSRGRQLGASAPACCTLCLLTKWFDFVQQVDNGSIFRAQDDGAGDGDGDADVAALDRLLVQSAEPFPIERGHTPAQS